MFKIPGTLEGTLAQPGETHRARFHLDKPADIAIVNYGSCGEIRVPQMLREIGLTGTRTDGERLLKAGAVEIDGVRQTAIVFHAQPGTHTVRAGKKWKKIRPQWTGKAVRIELTPAYRSEAPPKPKKDMLGQASEVAVFLLTTDAGAVWTSKDGTHWHQQ